MQCGLRLRGDPNIVTYRNEDWHVGCLLDKLIKDAPEEPAELWGFNSIPTNVYP